ncbi:hypothetical protein ROR02_08660 [Pararhodospirillum oryzae]|uniref:DUF4136 domain-containing protein n=1 Tax=Pararhodospirillum oryzae TaxID=478448 RepID=A0A512H5H9_9PROT|nr:hypothetical protein ROR02_08660 [Pararhodospirillum oryzae]
MLLALGTALALAACADSEVAPGPIEVSRSHVLPATPPPTTFAIVPASQAQAADPAFRAAANLVAAYLERLGHRRTVGGTAAHAAWRVGVEATMGGGATAEAGLIYGFSWQAPGPQVLGGGHAQQAAAPAPGGAIPKTLAVTITADNRTVYQGRATMTDPSPDLMGALAPLARALLDTFPGPVTPSAGAAPRGAASPGTSPPGASLSIRR